MIKNKRQMFIVIGVFTLVMLLGSVTYAFFNYTRTGAQNTIRVGRIAFVTRQIETINLTNLFPIDPTETGIMDDATKVGTLEIEIEGDTDYTDGVEYLISTTNSSVHTSTGKIIPISLNVTITDLGTPSDSYFTARNSKNANIYKRLSGDSVVGDQQLLVGYIKPNTTSGTIEGVDGKITIKAYFDENKIAISDTYDGRETDEMGTTSEWVDDRVVITTDEWNALQNTGISFQVKIEANEGIWVNEPMYDTIKTNAVMDNINSTYVNNATPGIDFSQISNDTNGKGVYIRAGTENDAYPIIYYRGDIDNNNVLFANKCWKIVRTTETGGIKMIYNGEPFDIYTETPLSENEYSNIVNTSRNSFTFSNNMWNTTQNDGYTTEISFTVPEGNNYKIIVSGTSVGNASGKITIYKDEDVVKRTSLIGYGFGMDLNYIFGNLSSSNVIKVKLDNIYAAPAHPISLNVQMVRQEGESQGISCDNKSVDTLVQLNGQSIFSFNTSNNSLAYSGYMYGTIYTLTNGSPISGAYFGNGYIYNNGVYTLTNAKVGIDNTHHYTCNLTTADGTCTSIRYYTHNFNDSTYLFMTLSNGESVEDALRNMQVNTNDSNAKSIIDSWYANYLNSYTNQLEDTIWCNDRSISELKGMNPNGGSLADTIYYSTYTRAYTTNQPSLSCINKNDAFTVSNSRGNQKLIYPIAMLTGDELMLSGAKMYQKGKMYTNSGVFAWSLSPGNVAVMTNGFFPYELILGATGISSSFVHEQIGIRPSISLKQGTAISNGDGTPTNPFIVK